MDPWLLRQCRLAERRGILTGQHLNVVQVFALEVITFAEWLEKQNSNPVLRRVRRDYADGLYDEDQPSGTDAAGDALEDLSAVKWEAPSDRSEEEVMAEIEQFNKAMAENVHQVVAEDGGGEWL